MGVDLTKHSLEIYRPKQLANLLGFEESALRVLASEVQNTAKRSKYINEFTIVDPREDRKRRDVISIRVILRLFSEGSMSEFYPK
jgi:hypothetical protein